MAIDREATLKNAEKFLRVGRLDAAITEYARAVEEQPRDWTTANTLGDLYLRAQQPERAVALYCRIADQLRTEGFYPKAAALYKKILKLTPGDEPVQLHLAEISARQGLLADAKAYFGNVATLRRQRNDTAGADEIVIRLGEIDAADLAARLASARALERRGEMVAAGRRYRELHDDYREKGRGRDAAAALCDCVRCDPSMHDVVIELAWTFTASNVEAATMCIDAVADDSIARGEFVEAAAILEQLAARVPGQIGTLLRLVEVAVDGGLETTMYEAQAQLADAYLAADRPEEARVIAEDLVTRDPGDVLHVERLRRALTRLNVDDVEAAIAARTTANVQEDGPWPPRVPTTPPSPEPPAPSPVQQPPAATALTAAEIDLTALLDQLEGQAATPPSPEVPPRPARELEDVFAEMRREATTGAGEDQSAEHFALARSYLEIGQPEDAIAPLETASRSPQHRFTAASLLGQIYRDQSDLPRAIDWFERALEAPAPSPGEGHALLYDLGDVLEAMGESSRALAVFLELAADVPDFRDVNQRITNLSSAETEG